MDFEYSATVPAHVSKWEVSRAWLNWYRDDALPVIVEINADNSEKVRRARQLWYAADFENFIEEHCGYDLVNKYGKLSKRFSKMWYTHFGYSMSNEEKNTLGNLINSFKVAEITIDFSYVDSDFIRDEMADTTWNDGETSCMANGGAYAKGRFEIAQNPQYYGAIVAQDSYGKLGRCWVTFPHEYVEGTPLNRVPRVIFFNGYGCLGGNLQAIATAVAKTDAFGEGLAVRILKNHKITASNSQIWPNVSRGYFLVDTDSKLLGDDAEDHYDGVKLPHVDFDWNDYEAASGASGCSCEYCGDFVTDEQAYVVNDIFMCEDCYCEHYATCEWCDGTVHVDDILYAYQVSIYGRRTEMLVCRHCAEYHGTICNDCGDVYMDHEEMIFCEDDQEYYCEDCASGIEQCRECEEYHFSERMYRCTSCLEYTCEDCIRNTEDHPTCRECGKMHCEPCGVSCDCETT